MTDTHSPAPYPQKAIALCASGYASELKVDTSELDALLDRGWTFVASSPLGVGVGGAGSSGVAYAAAATLVIVEWRQAEPPG